jgi:hypothetical protein
LCSAARPQIVLRPGNSFRPPPETAAHRAAIASMTVDLPDPFFPDEEGHR